MDALRRLFGGGGTAGAADGAGDGDLEAEIMPPSAEEIRAEERARELELLRAEQARLGDLVLRQQRYADRKWVPPSQGGSRRSDDGEKDVAEDR
jgi:hypothetical protein